MTAKQAAIQIIRKLKDSGFEALLAGGCVRDMLLEKRPKDYDVATSATPEEICKIFRRTIKVGAKFGVIIVLIDSVQVEIATFRADMGYSDGRRPDKIKFTSAKEDAIRRDFTINGMFYDPLKKDLIDYVGGKKDLAKKVIKTIGKPAERFSEDYLRMLRAVRFSAQLNFKIETSTKNAVKKLASNIAKISGERIAAELESLSIAKDYKNGIKLLIETGLAEKMFPVFSEQIIADKTTEIFEYLPAKISFPLFISAMFWHCQSRKALAGLKILKLSRQKLKHIKFLLENRGTLLCADMSLAELKIIFAEPYFEDLYSFQTAIQKFENQSLSPLRKIRQRTGKLDRSKLKPKPLLDGNEILALGVKPGPQVGVYTKKLYLAQLSEEISTKKQAIGWIKKQLQKKDI